MNHNDDLYVETYWSRCLDRYWWGVEFKAFGKNQILDLFVVSGDTTVIMLLFLGWCYCFLSMILWDRISKVYEMVHLWWKCHNSTVFRLRIENSVCTSSNDKITEEKWTLTNDQCRRNSRERRWGNRTYPTLVTSRSSRTSSK